MQVICPKCKTVMGYLTEFDGIVDGHCLCGEHIQLSFTHSNSDISFDFNANYDYIESN